jgi:cytidine deaminase
MVASTPIPPEPGRPVASQNLANDRQLVEAAAEARRFAYAPYSGFFVGSALLSADGTIHRGANIENASYGLTICAERSAYANAICQGGGHFLAIAIVSPGGVTPCGACRQFMLEFSPQLRVLVADADDLEKISVHQLSDLLPSSFSAAKLPPPISHFGEAK